MRIGVFDSGIGGLTVLREIHRLCPGHSTLYLGDTARVPYGVRSPETVRRYALGNVAFLLREGVDLIVVACNTASAHAAGAFAELPVPVIGVIEPGARRAAEVTPPGCGIGVLGTAGTVRSGAYERILRDLRPDAPVRSLACPLFVPLVEEGWVTGDVARGAAEVYLQDWIGRASPRPASPAAERAPGTEHDPGTASACDTEQESGAERAPATVILGCTHYPLLRPLLAELLGPEVRLVDSAEATARAVREHLKGGPQEIRPRHDIRLTDISENFTTFAQRILREAASPEPAEAEPAEIELIDIEPVRTPA